VQGGKEQGGSHQAPSQGHAIIRETVVEPAISVGSDP